jgi:hypothetical protein
VGVGYVGWQATKVAPRRVAVVGAPKSSQLDDHLPGSGFQAALSSPRGQRLAPTWLSDVSLPALRRAVLPVLVVRPGPGLLRLGLCHRIPRRRPAQGRRQVPGEAPSQAEGRPSAGRLSSEAGRKSNASPSTCPPTRCQAGAGGGVHRRDPSPRLRDHVHAMRRAEPTRPRPQRLHQDPRAPPVPRPRVPQWLP